ncbi:LysR family transcriptional regulator [Microbacterium protaetiae]|uniref:LysR family transcriptional regulator n=1 Tax=Microbacterium protaetiae TaxID=2509458 RepID=A0A4P6EAT1_9MICO|nr:LysR family transcriptional regulator [Microbacterium protaetiae]QAY59250.1 LysR family transcriptional regulator [Microbacterium protaetiae]
MDETLEISLLRTFVAIDDWGGFGRAASALRKSQPTVSQHVRTLERRLGHALVERDGRKAKFTGAGERLLVEARRIIAVHDEALVRLDPTAARPLVVAATEMMAPALLTALTAGRGIRPAPPFTFLIERSGALTDAVAAGTVDLAVVLALGPDASGVELGAVPLRWFAAPGWQPPTDRPLPFVSHAEPPGLAQHAMRVLQDQVRQVETVAESPGLAGACAAARAGLGVAALPAAETDGHGLVSPGELPDLGAATVRLVARPGVDEQLLSRVARALADRFGR